MVMLLLEDWRIGAAVAAFVATYLAVQLYGLRIAVPLWRRHRRASADLSGFIGERYPGVADIQKSGAEAHAMSGFRGKVLPWVSSHYRAIMTSIVAWMVSLVVLRTGNVLAMGVGGALFLSGTITVGTVFLVFQYLRLMTFPLMALSEELQDLQRSRASIDRIQGLFAQQPGVVGGSEEGTGGPMSVEFRDVSFSYLPDHPVLNDVSFKVEPGRVLGVLGRTGSGKTTLSRLIFRQYDAGEGAVDIGGMDIKAMGLAGLRGRVGMVTQDVQLFNAPLRENLAMFDRSIADDRLVKSLTALRLGPWYASLPDGLDTVLASGGDLLSAGEAQLVAFARVLLSGPDLVILDEASSRLDPATERLVEGAVDRLLEGRTAIVIAHRLATLERVDDVMIMDGGRVVEFGPRQVLVADADSRYASLLRTGMEEVLA
jgi:ATP-binding cassette subfamily B protein